MRRPDRDLLLARAALVNPVLLLFVDAAVSDGVERAPAREDDQPRDRHMDALALRDSEVAVGPASVAHPALSGAESANDAMPVARSKRAYSPPSERRPPRRERQAGIAADLCLPRPIQPSAAMWQSLPRRWIEVTPGDAGSCVCSPGATCRPMILPTARRSSVSGLHPHSRSAARGAQFSESVPRNRRHPQTGASS